VTVAVSDLPGIRRVEHVMGMPIYLDVRDEAGADMLEPLLEWLRWVDATFSTYKEESEIRRIARGELTVEDADPEVRAVLARCRLLQGETRGYFDVEADALDPSGYVKGWAVDRGARLLEQTGLRNYAINAAGDIRTAGRAIPDPGWRVGIEHPLEHDKVAAVVELHDGAVATSAAYARGDHVRDPRTGLAPVGVLSVTVTGPELGIADAYATAAFAMGQSGPAWTARLRGYEALTILADGRVLSTPGFPWARDSTA
jgi:FAD:protein FMN transferase